MSWRTIRQAFKNPQMRKRIGLVLVIILIFRVLSHIPIPLAEPTQLKQLLDNLFNSQQLLGFFDLLSGGALSNFSIVLMGLGPYITASIIMQLLTKAIPKLEEINKEGEAGRRRINQYTRLATLPLAIIQSLSLIVLIRQQAGGISGLNLSGGGLFQWVLMIAAVTGGAMLLMWLGELLSEQGVGNGISILIFAGIISQLPSIAGTLISTLVGENAAFSVFGWFTLPISLPGLLLVLGIVLTVLLVTYWVVKLNEAQRVITVSYAKRVRGNRAYGGVDTVLPIKLLTAGVIPIIFASSFLMVPYFLGSLLRNVDTAWLSNLGERMATLFQQTNIAPTAQGTLPTDFLSYIYPFSYFVLVVLFTYFYTSLMFNAKEIAENLQKQGGFIGGIRPGKQTEAYLKRVVGRLTLFGAMALGLMALLPYIIDAVVITFYHTPLSSSLTIGGTGVLITVSVAIETLRQIESRALMVTYDQD